MYPIAHIRSPFKSKFGVPRQSGLVHEVKAEIVFEPPFRNPEALRGLEGFSHIWLLWDFSEAPHDGKWSPTVRPPRLGGNKRMGVFATRSPFRPNPIGLSSVRLTGIRLHTPEGPVLEVAGADLMDGTPILDIKPYLPFTDSHPQATGGFTTDTLQQEALHVQWATKERETGITPTERKAVEKCLQQDPRPHYHHDPLRIYTMEFAGHEIHFRVAGDTIQIESVL